ISGTTADAINDYSASGLGPLAPPCWEGLYNESLSCAGPDVVYQWTVPADGEYVFSLCGSLYDTGLLIMQPNCPLSPADYLCGNDDACGLQSELAVTLPAGQEIFIVVDGYASAAGDYTLTVAVSEPPLPPCTVFDSFFDIFTLIDPERVIGSHVLNTTLVPGTMNHVLGRSLLIGTPNNDNTALEFLAVKLDQYLPLGGPVPEFVFSLSPLEISLSQPVSFCVVERALGVEREELPMPPVLSDAEEPLILLAGQFSSQIAAYDLHGNLRAGPYTGGDMGIPTFYPSAITFDDDHLLLYALDQQQGLIHTIFMPFDEPPVLIASAPVPDPIPLSARIEGMWSVDSFFDIYYTIEFPSGAELHGLNMSEPLAPAPLPPCEIPIEIVSLDLSSGYGPIGVGQLVGVRQAFTGFEVVVGDPPTPAPLPIYLQPIPTIQIASEDETNLQGAVDIRGSLLGPWWPDRVRFQKSYDGVNYTDFFVDEDGLDVIAHTWHASPFMGDGWHALLTPATEEPESLYIQLCYEVEINGMLVYIVRRVKIQDVIKPDIVEPGQDGNIRIPPLQPGGIVHLHPTRVDCTVVFRRIPAPSVADSVKPIAQRRDSLSSWGSGVNGGDHCGPTAAAANLLALAMRNADLCKLLEKFWGRPSGAGCANPTADELTRLIKELGKCMKTNDGSCGTWTSNIIPGIECFIKKLRGMFPDSTRPDPKLRLHWISSGANYDSLKWEDIWKEFEERHQNIDILATDTLGSYGHFMAIIAMSKPDSAGIAEVKIADSWDDTVYTVKVDTRKIPPRFLPPLPGGNFWGQIYQAIAQSNPDSLTADDMLAERGERALDEDRYPWAIVQVENGASASFPLDDATPGWWTYAVRVWTPEGDSATAYRTFYVGTPPNLVIHAASGNTELNWQGDPLAVSYIIWVADSAHGPFTFLDEVAGTSYTVAVGADELKFFRVQTKWVP
ncbi:hypothetical protein KJ815_10830, partial [bacterium]|nr:hypothetical protein [bacterium]